MELKANVLNSETITVVDVSLTRIGYAYRPGMNTAGETGCAALFTDTCGNLIISMNGFAFTSV